MNAAIYIAKRMKGDGTSVGKVSRLGTRIATASVAVSLFIMILALAIVRGFKTEIEAKAIGFTGQLVMEAPGAGFVTEAVPTTTALSYYQALAHLPEVASIQPVATANGIIRTEEAIQGVSLKGVGPSFQWTFFEQALTEGHLPNVADTVPSTEVLISARLSSMLQLGCGDVFTMYFIGDNVRVRKFSVSGIYDAQLEDLDNHLLVGDIRQSQKINGWRPDQVSGVEFFLRKGIDMDRGQRLVEDYIFAHATEEDPGVVLRNVKYVYVHLYDWLALMHTNVWILLALMVLVAGFNMISGLLIMLFEKTSMIGLLKGVGMKDKDVRFCFLYRSAGIVGKGVAIGTLLAVAFCWVQQTTHFIRLNPINYFVDRVPIHLTPLDVVGVALGGMVLILLILNIPLRSITRVSPSEAIRMR